MFTCICAYTYVCAYVCAFVCICACVFVYGHVCVACLRVHKALCVGVYIYAYVCACVCACMHIRRPAVIVRASHEALVPRSLNFACCWLVCVVASPTATETPQVVNEAEVGQPAISVMVRITVHCQSQVCGSKCAIFSPRVALLSQSLSEVLLGILQQCVAAKQVPPPSIAEDYAFLFRHHRSCCLSYLMCSPERRL